MTGGTADGAGGTEGVLPITGKVETELLATAVNKAIGSLTVGVEAGAGLAGRGGGGSASMGKVATDATSKAMG